MRAQTCATAGKETGFCNLKPALRRHARLRDIHSSPKSMAILCNLLSHIGHKTNRPDQTLRVRSCRPASLSTSIRVRHAFLPR